MKTHNEYRIFEGFFFQAFLSRKTVCCTWKRGNRTKNDVEVIEIRFFFSYSPQFLPKLQKEAVVGQLYDSPLLLYTLLNRISMEYTLFLTFDTYVILCFARYGSAVEAACFSLFCGESPLT